MPNIFCFCILSFYNILYNKINTVDKAPQNKCVCRTVPKSAYGKCNKVVAAFFKLSFSVSAERNIKVVAKPTAERNMPTAPKLRNAC